MDSCGIIAHHNIILNRAVSWTHRFICYLFLYLTEADTIFKYVLLISVPTPVPDPICQPDCVKGECVEGNICNCPVGFTGNSCEIRK